MESFDFFKEPTLIRFCSDLAAIFQDRSLPQQKVKAVASYIGLFLNSRSYPISNERRERLEIARYRVPYPVYVKIRANKKDIYVVSPYNDIEPVGPPVHFEIRDGLLLVVEGAEKLFKKSPHLKDLCNICVRQLSQCIGHVNSSAIVQELPTSGLKSDVLHDLPSFDTYDKRFVNWSPMAEGFESLAGEFHPDVTHRLRLRWAWVTRGIHVKTKRPYIYLLGSDAKTLPRILNGDGSEGLIHNVLKDNSPQLLWNYVHNPKWNLPLHIKEEFITEAQSDKFPHLMYIPILGLDRLAAQITFGPDDDLTELIAAGHRIVNLAPIVLLSGFQELVFRSMLNLFYEHPSFNGSGVAGQTSGISAMQELLSFLTESCPVPALNVAHSKTSLLEFSAAIPSCPLGKTFAMHGNSAIEQALEASKTKSQAESLRKFGSTLMTAVHTRRRPLQNMQSYVEAISKVPGLPDDIVGRTRDIGDFLKRVEVFVELEIFAHEAVFPKHKAISSPEGEHLKSSSSAEDVMRFLHKAKYDPAELKPNIDGRFPKEVSVVDPIHRQHVVIKWEPDSRYAATAAPLALITAELIDNAAKYLKRASKSTNAAWVDVLFSPSHILVANDIVPDDMERVQTRLKKARNEFSKSLNRAWSWAELIGFEIDWNFSSPTRLNFIVRPI